MSKLGPETLYKFPIKELLRLEGGVSTVNPSGGERYQDKGDLGRTDQILAEFWELDRKRINEIAHRYPLTAFIRVSIAQDEGGSNNDNNNGGGGDKLIPPKPFQPSPLEGLRVQSKEETKKELLVG